MSATGLVNAVFRRLSPVLLSALLLSGLSACSVFGGGKVDPGVAKSRAELDALKADPDLATRAPAAIDAAGKAITAAEQGASSNEQAAHLQYIADRKVRTAKALAEARRADDQIKSITDAQGAGNTCSQAAPEPDAPMPSERITINPSATITSTPH